MITDSLIKQEFIHNILQRDARLIADTQVDRLRRHRTQRARQIALQLAGQPFRISGTGLHATLTFNIMTSLRFMDISISRDIRAGASKALALYNRVVWGILYHDTLGDLKFGLTEDLRRQIHAQIQAAGPVMDRS
ncbi:MAG: hypothetical protein IKO33_05325 [Bacteroidaceae bacterium]|nr:hypothetical protein [Bacteroidaceae bacterium]